MAAAPSFTIPKKTLTWLITGSSSGFGLSLTRTALKAGHKVIATSRNPSATPDLVKEVESAGGQWHYLDVTSPSAPKLISDLESKGTEIDVLVNNAGYSVFAPIETTSDEDLRQQTETLYFGPVRLIKAVLPFQRKRKFGVIVNFSSGAALQGNDTMGAYAGAKAGLDGLTKVLAKEVAAYNIRALTIVLGTFNTNMGSAAVFSKQELPEDYVGTMSDNMIKYIKSGKVPINGDKDKAMKAVFELVTGTGFGAGKESEKLLPLGTDMTARVKGQLEYYQHALDVFGDVTNNVNIDK